jgi:hypothetical protein
MITTILLMEFIFVYLMLGFECTGAKVAKVFMEQSRKEQWFI